MSYKLLLPQSHNHSKIQRLELNLSLQETFYERSHPSRSSQSATTDGVPPLKPAQIVLVAVFGGIKTETLKSTLLISDRQNHLRPIY